MNSETGSSPTCRTTTPLASDVDKPRLLFVEDDVLISDVMSEILEDTFQVMMAQNGQQALELALELHPDAIVTDFHLPGLTGEILIKTLRGNPDFNGTPIICVSSISNMRDAMESGADAFLAKPYDYRQLVDAIQSHLTS